MTLTSHAKSLALRAPDAQGLIQFTRKEFAVLANTCERTIKRAVDAGQVKEIKMTRRRVRYTLEAVQAYLAGKYPSTAAESSSGGLNANDGNDCSPTRPDEGFQETSGTTTNREFPRKSAENTKKGGKSPIIKKFAPTHLPDSQVTTATEVTKRDDATILEPLEVQKSKTPKAKTAKKPEISRNSAGHGNTDGVLVLNVHPKLATFARHEDSSVFSRLRGCFGGSYVLLSETTKTIVITLRHPQFTTTAYPPARAVPALCRWLLRDGSKSSEMRRGRSVDSDFATTFTSHRLSSLATDQRTAFMKVNQTRWLAGRC